MRQVAHVGALAFDDLMVVGHQGVQFTRERLKLERIVSTHPFGPARADRRDLASKRKQRQQPDPDLHDHGGDQTGGQKNQCDGDGGHEGAHVAVERSDRSSAIMNTTGVGMSR